VRRLDALVQRVVARRHRAHEDVGAARGVLGERLHRDVDGGLVVAVGGDRERREREAGAPRVV